MADNRARSQRVHIRTNDEHLARWRRLVGKSGLPQNLLFEKLVEGVEIVNVKQYTALRTELKKQGNNLNQLTRRIHLGETLYPADVIEELMRVEQAYLDLLKTINDSLIGKKI